MRALLHMGKQQGLVAPLLPDDLIFAAVDYLP